MRPPRTICASLGHFLSGRGARSGGRRPPRRTTGGRIVELRKNTLHHLKIALPEGTVKYRGPRVIGNLGDTRVTRRLVLGHFECLAQKFGGDD